MSKKEYEERLNYIFIHSTSGNEFMRELQKLKEAMKSMAESEKKEDNKLFTGIFKESYNHR